VSKAKEVLNRIAVIIKEWKTFPSEIQEQFSREELLNKAVVLIHHENVSVIISC